MCFPRAGLLSGFFAIPIRLRSRGPANPAFYQTNVRVVKLWNISFTEFSGICGRKFPTNPKNASILGSNRFQGIKLSITWREGGGQPSPRLRRGWQETTLFWSEQIYDLIEAGVGAEGGPVAVEAKLAVADEAGSARGNSQLFQGRSFSPAQA
jgi:hypothetical protein